MPNLIEIQKDSYQWFLDEGLKEAFADISPIADFAGQSAPKILFDQESLPGHSAQGEGAGQASPAPAPCGPPGAGGAGRLG